MEDIINLLIPEEKREYKCYDLLKEKIENDIDFCKTILEGIRDKKISSFDIELINKLNTLNLRGNMNDMDQVLLYGANIGACTTMSQYLSYIINGSTRCAGILPLIKGTHNSPNGEHTWLESRDGKIYDPSLMLVIDKSYMSKIGYQEEVRKSYSQTNFYYERRDFALDSKIKISSNKGKK